MCPVDLLISSPASRFSAEGLKRGFQPQLFSFSLFRTLPKLFPHSPSCTPRRRTEKNVSSWPGWLTAPCLILQLVSGNGKLRKAQPFLDKNNLLDSQIAELVVTPGPEILQRIGVRSEPAATTRTRCVNNTQLHSRVKSQGVFIIINVKVCK